MSALGWAGLTVADVVLLAANVAVLRWALRRWRELVENWTDDND